jgi:hypothetical protein
MHRRRPALHFGRRDRSGPAATTGTTTTAFTTPPTEAVRRPRHIYREQGMTSSAKFIRYLIGGLVIGAFWYINRGRPPLEGALRTIVVFAAVMFFISTRLKHKGVEVRLAPLIASKAVLVVIAALIEQGIKGSVDNASLYVSIGLAAVVALLGPLGDSHYFTSLQRAAATTNPDM